MQRKTKNNQINNLSIQNTVSENLISDNSSNAFFTHHFNYIMNNKGRLTQIEILTGHSYSQITLTRK
ncbi:hypothetical protein F1Z66_08950 [Candidatus Nitrosocosmicus sp. SS]|nr:hypothetical protein F1Z66_08950 [Candidatus Nitrosocosmicus sp. SS]